jgi:hypothetical protein
MLLVVNKKPFHDTRDEFPSAVWYRRDTYTILWKDTSDKAKILLNQICFIPEATKILWRTFSPLHLIFFLLHESQARVT